MSSHCKVGSSNPTESSSTGFPFFELPGELQNNIYNEYFLEPGGYYHDHESGKLRAVDGRLIALNLRRTCKKVAEDTRSLPFGLNPITFCTTIGEEIEERGKRSHAGRAFDTFRACYHAFFDMEALAHHLITPKITQEVMKLRPLYPGLEHILSLGPKDRKTKLMNGVPFLFDGKFYYGKNWKIVLSIIESLLDEKRDDFLAATRHSNKPPLGLGPRYFEDGSQESLILSGTEPWYYPSIDELRMLELILPPAKSKLDDRFRPERFSATAVAIRFLNRLPEEEWKTIDEIVIHEDCWGILFPEGHGEGLIPLMKENPDLKITARVHITSTVMTKIWDTQGGLQQTFKFFIEPLTMWLKHALELGDLGMSEGRYTLVFTSDSRRFTQAVCNMVKNVAKIVAAAVQDWEETPHVRPPRILQEPDHLVMFSKCVKKVFSEKTCVRFDEEKQMNSEWDL